MEKSTKRRPTTYSGIVRRHRQQLDMDIVEYAILARCNPAQVIDAERGHAKLPPESETRLSRHQLPNLVGKRLASPKMTRRGDMWQDCPVENHLYEICEGGATQEEVGAALGLSPQAVQLIEQKALAKLHPLVSVYGMDKKLRAMVIRLRARAEVANVYTAATLLELAQEVEEVLEEEHALVRGQEVA